jgi:hypothetical protein
MDKEEEQIQVFVHQAVMDEQVRAELLHSPAVVIARQGFSPRVERIMARLAPQLALTQSVMSTEHWWHV